MANISRFDPRADYFGDLVDDLFKGFLVRPMYAEGRETLARVKVDVTEKNGAYLVHAELPGVKKEDIAIEIDGDTVTIAAEVKRESEAKEGEKVLRSERFYGKTQRAFALPAEVDEARVEAKFADGVLELVLPKKAPSVRKIQVN